MSETSCDSVVSARSEVWVRLFTRYVRRYLASHFHAVRLLTDSSSLYSLVATDKGPLVVYLNHAAWWDPLVCLILADHLFPGRRHFAPIDAAALGGYSLFRKLGFFGIEPATARGAAEFLRAARAILREPKNGLWITAEGKFTDPRQRPVRLRPGLAHLARRLSHGTIVPIAIEYAFWQERTPEVLVCVGESINLDAGRSATQTIAQWNDLLESRMTAAQDRLAGAARQRDPASFRSLLAGRAGVGGVYDLWRRTLARIRGVEFSPEHERR